MKRIFLVLAIASTMLLGIALALGWMIDDPTSRDIAVQNMVRNHFFAAVGGLIFAIAVHALVLTYFMGTGRWIEETSQAYALNNDWRDANQKLKYQTLPVMVLCVLLLITTGALGGAADPASAVEFQGMAGMSAATVHFLVAAIAVTMHIVAGICEYLAIERNMELVDSVMTQVQRIRRERGLPV